MSNYIILKGNKVKLSDVVTDCNLNLCVDTKIGEPLPSILSKLCKRISSKGNLRQGSGITITGSGSTGDPYVINANVQGLSAKNGIQVVDNAVELGANPLYKATNIDVADQSLFIGTANKGLTYTGGKVALTNILNIEPTGALKMSIPTNAITLGVQGNTYRNDGGKLAAGTYYFRLYAFDALGNCNLGENYTISVNGIIGSQDEADIWWTHNPQVAKYRVYVSLSSDFSNARYKDFIVGTPVGDDYHLCCDFMSEDYFYLYTFNTPDDRLTAGTLPENAGTWVNYTDKLDISSNYRHIDQLLIGATKVDPTTLPTKFQFEIRKFVGEDGFMALKGNAPSIRFMNDDNGNSLNCVWAGATVYNNYLQGAQVGDQIMINYRGRFIMSANGYARNYPVDFLISNDGRVVIGNTYDNLRAKLQVYGNIQSTALESSMGNRLVYADINGVLQASTTKYENNGNFVWNTATRQPNSAFNVSGFGTVGQFRIENAGGATTNNLLYFGASSNGVISLVDNNKILNYMAVNGHTFAGNNINFPIIRLNSVSRNTLFGDIATELTDYRVQIEGNQYVSGSIKFGPVGPHRINDRTDANLNGLEFGDWRLIVNGTNRLELNTTNGPIHMTPSADNIYLNSLVYSGAINITAPSGQGLNIVASTGSPVIDMATSDGHKWRIADSWDGGGPLQFMYANGANAWGNVVSFSSNGKISGSAIGFNSSIAPADFDNGKFSMGYDGSGGWMQSWGGLPLRINPYGNNVTIGSTFEYRPDIGALTIKTPSYAGNAGLTIYNTSGTGDSWIEFQNTNGSIGQFKATNTGFTFNKGLTVTTTSSNSSPLNIVGNGYDNFGIRIGYAGSSFASLGLAQGIFTVFAANATLNLQSHNIKMHNGDGTLHTQFDTNGNGSFIGDIEITDATKGIIMKTPDGTKRFRYTIDNNGDWVKTQL